MPRRSPSARSSASPSASAASSAVWCVAGLEVAGALEHEVEARRGTRAARAGGRRARRRSRRGRGPRRRARGARGCRVSAVARTWRARRPPAAATGARPVERARERLEQQVVVLAVAHGEADRRPGRRGRRARAEQRVGDRVRLVDRDEEEVRARRQRLEPERAQRAREPLALLDLRLHVGRLGERGERERRRERRDRRRRLAAVQLGRRLGVGERVADARAGEAERLRERAQHDRRRRRSAPTAVSPAYSKYASSTTSGRASGQGAERARRVVRAAAERDDRVVVADLRAGEPGGDRGRAGTSARRRSRRCRPDRRTRARRAGSGRRRRRRGRRSRARRRRSRAIARSSSG